MCCGAGVPGLLPVPVWCRTGAFFRCLVLVRGGLAEVGPGDGDGGDGGGLGAEDAGAEGDGLPGMRGEEVDLFGGPTAFRADGEGNGEAGPGVWLGAEGG